jgi:hypothetical protein
MITYARLAQKPIIFQNFTGLTVATFTELRPRFSTAYEPAPRAEAAMRGTPRQRHAGAGRPATLATPAAQLLFILCYFKFYPTQAVQGFLFGFSQAQAHVWIHRLTPVLNAALGDAQQLPARKATSVQQVLAACPGLEFVIDRTERPIQRPPDPRRQQDSYSGKKKRDTVKNMVITDKRSKKIKAVRRTRPGRTHDKTVTDDEAYQFAAGSTLFKATGFQGYEPAGITTRQPKKKPRTGRLTDAEQAVNQSISRQRMGVEHSIGGANVYRIVRDIYRNHRPAYEDLIFETACGLHHVRCDVRCIA